MVEKAILERKDRTMKKNSIGTECVQAGYTPGNGEPRQIPIVQSTTFRYETSEDMGKLFDLEASGYFYTRLQNPTNDMVAAKIAALEGGSAAMLTSSGQAANFMALFNICESGSHIVSSSSIYGGTFNLISVTMARIARRKNWTRRFRTIPGRCLGRRSPIPRSRCWISSGLQKPPTPMACR